MAFGEASSTGAFGESRPKEAEQRVLDSLRRDGIALVSFHELFEDDRVWADLEADIREFARATEARASELLQRDDDKAYIARRFVVRKTGDTKGRKWKFSLTDPWLSFGLSHEILGIVNAYRKEPTQLIDLDNWYTIPDPNAHERTESQRWHRDPWDNHIVKVFVYFSDVDEDAGPLEYVVGSPAGGRYGDLWPWISKGIYPPQDEVERAVAREDFLTVTGPAGTIIFCDTSGFHRGGWARAKPRVLSYHTYVSPASTKAPRFRVRWSDDGASLSPDAQFAVSWSRKEKENLDSL